MKYSYLLIALLFLIGCKDKSAKEEVTQDDVEDFMENVFGEKSGKPFDCDALIADADFSKLCMTRNDDYRVNKDIENPLICIHVFKSKKSTVDLAINRSPMSMITGQVFNAAKSKAKKRGKVKKVSRLGKDAFYVEYKFSSGEYGTQNRDLIFYEDKSMYTLHTVSTTKGGKNCMSNQSQLKRMAEAVLDSARK